MGIQLFLPTFDIDACLKEIRECLEKGWTGVGFKTAQFEEQWKRYTGLPHAYFLNSATSGLNLAFEIFKDEDAWAGGDEIITTPLTFVSTNHAILLAGLRPVFADIDDSLCLDPEKVEKAITPKTRGVCFVGFGGSTGRYMDVVSICKKHNLRLILDAAHLAGTRLDGEIPGKEADVVIYSYQAVKNLPTGDSGMICFKDSAYDEIARRKGWLGINKDTYTRSISNGGNYKWKYDVEYTGNKYHGNSIMASIAIAQLPLLERDNAYRRQIAAWYEGAFKKYPEKIKLINIPKNCESSRHLFQILVQDRDGLLNYLNEHDIYPGVHYIDNTEYRMYAYGKRTCPNARYASDHIISLPMHLRLSYEDVQYIIKHVLFFIAK
jgi:dTDP-4-amino-4,6-dideoxygalactose transaminase